MHVSSRRLPGARRWSSRKPSSGHARFGSSLSSCPHGTTSTMLPRCTGCIGNCSAKAINTTAPERIGRGTAQPSCGISFAKGFSIDDGLSRSSGPVSRGRLIAFSVSGLALLALTPAALFFQSQNDFARFLAVALLQGTIYALAVWSVWRLRSSSRVVLGIGAIAVLMRVPVVLSPPYLSTDVYRYVWDGRVVAAGINPYRYVPADPHLQALRDPEIFPNINRADSAVTIYPPFAEVTFLAVTRVSESVTGMKAAMVGFEIVAFALLVSLLVAEGLPAGRVAVYAWHPLALWEFAGSGHIDAALVALVVAGLWAARRGRNVLTGLFLAGRTLQ